MSMPEANNAIDPSHVLRVGWCGAPTEFHRFARAIDACTEFHLVATAGIPGSQEPVGNVNAECRHFRDAGEMIEKSDIQALVLACPLPDALPLAKAALHRGLHVWRRPPLGRDLAEAVSVAKVAAGAPVLLKIGSWWQAARELFPTLIRSAAEPAVCELCVSASGPEIADWRRIRSEAGGGSLMQDGYELLEVLLDYNGIPDAVYGVVNRAARDAGRPHRDVEDWAAAVFRYAAGGAATVTCSWSAQAFESRLSRHTASESLLIEAARICLSDAAGVLRSEMNSPTELLPIQMQSFAAAIVDDGRRREAIRSLQRHVATSAAIEAIYLSDRTSQPESPRTLCELHGWPEPQP